jgi:hypothetical protein
MDPSIENIKETWIRTWGKFNAKYQIIRRGIIVDKVVYNNGSNRVDSLWHDTCRDNPMPIWQLESCEYLIDSCDSVDSDYIRGWFDTLGFIMRTSYNNLIFITTRRNN